MSGSSYIYVDSQAGLAAALAQLARAPALAVDTEFVKTKTYYPIAGLVQAYDGSHAYLLDPIALPGLPGLLDLLLDPGLVKVLHACGEDMEVFQRLFGATPAPVFDTQIAAAALGTGFSLGYQALVERHFGIALPKDETRSDWRQRPLSASQLEYASLDVIYLLQVYERQQAALAASPKRAWVEAESARLAKDLPSLAPAEQLYRSFKGLNKLDGQQLGVLRDLCAWREARARRKDLPRRWVADDKALYVIAKERLDSLAGLREVAGLSKGLVRRYGDELLNVAAKARPLPKTDWPPEAGRQGGLAITDERIKGLRRLVEDKASRLEVAPELLATRRHLEALLRSVGTQSQSQPELLAGWRRGVIGDELLESLSEAR